MEDANLEEIKNALNKIQKLKERTAKKDRFCRLYSKVNRNYKELPWYKDAFSPQEINDVSDNLALPVWRKMREYGWIKVQLDGKRRNDSHYKKTNVENIFLLQELMCQMDDEFWQSYDKKYKKKKPWKPEMIPFFFDSAYLGRIQICKYPKSRDWKAELLTEFLHKKEFLFDEDSPYYKGLEKTKRFIEKSLMNGSVEKWEHHLQRFLLQK